MERAPGLLDAAPETLPDEVRVAATTGHGQYAHSGVVIKSPNEAVVDSLTSADPAGISSNPAMCVSIIRLRATTSSIHRDSS